MVPETLAWSAALLRPTTTLLAAERMPAGGAVVLAALFVVSGALVAALSWRLATGAIGRNHLMGLRLPSTMRSDEAWAAGQRAFAPWGLAAGLGAAVIGSTLILRPTQGLAVFIASAASIWLVVMPGIGAYVGDQAAKSA